MITKTEIAMARKELEQGDRVMAPNVKRGGIYSGEIIDVLSVMYYVHFDCGAYDFIYKAQQITKIPEEKQ